MGEGRLNINLRVAQELEPGVVELPSALAWHTRKRDQVLPKNTGEGTSGPARPEAWSQPLLSIARGRALVEELTSCQVTSTNAIAAREGLSERSVRTTVSLAFLAPDLVKAAVDCRLMRNMGMSSFAELPSEWAEQNKTLRCSR